MLLLRAALRVTLRAIARCCFARHFVYFAFYVELNARAVVSICYVVNSNVITRRRRRIRPRERNRMNRSRMNRSRTTTLLVILRPFLAFPSTSFFSHFSHDPKRENVWIGQHALGRW